MDLEQHNKNGGNNNYASTEMTVAQEANQQIEALPDEVHTFNVVEYQRHEDEKYMRKVAHANFEIQRNKEEIGRLEEALETIKVKHGSIRNLVYRNSYWQDVYQNVADSRSKQLVRIQDFLRKDATKKELRLCLPNCKEDELIKLRNKLNHRAKYKVLSGNEERKLMKQIKEVEATRADIVANALSEAKHKKQIEEKENQRLFNRIVDKPVKEWIKSQVKSIKVLKEMQLEHMEKVKHLKKDLKAVDSEMRLLKERISNAGSKMAKAHQALLKSEKFRTN